MIELSTNKEGDGRKEERKDKEDPNQIANRQTNSPIHHQDLRVVPLRLANYRKLARVRLAPNHPQSPSPVYLFNNCHLFFPKQGGEVECVRSNGSAPQDMHGFPDPTLSALQAIEHRKHLTHFVIKVLALATLEQRKEKKKGNGRQRYDFC